MKYHKIILDNKRIYNNGMAASVKGVVYEIEPILAEMAKSIQEGVTVVVEIKIVGKKKNIEENLSEGEEEEILDEEIGVAKNLDDPFVNVKVD